MKTLLSLILLILSASPVFAATWYATAATPSTATNINAVGTWVPTSTGVCTGSGTSLVWGSQANGDIFDTNGCTAIAVNVDPGVATGASTNNCGSVTVTPTLQANVTTSSAFNYATATNTVIHANITAGKYYGLSITGSSGGGTICGNITGSSGTAGTSGVNDAHTGSGITMYVVGNINAATDGSGYTFAGSGGALLVATGIVTGNAANTSSSAGLVLTNTGNATVNGVCVGGDSFAEPGCSGSATGGGGIAVNGSIINGKLGSGVQVRVTLTQSPTNYMIYPADSSYSLSNCWNGSSITLGTCTHAIILTMPPGLTCPTGCTASTNSNVANGVTFGPYTGSASGSGSAVSAASNW